MGVVVGLAVGKPVVGVALGFAKKQGQGLLNMRSLVSQKYSLNSKNKAYNKLNCCKHKNYKGSIQNHRCNNLLAGA